MQITVEQAAGAVPITILATHGDLDASSYQDLIAKANDVYLSGSRYILIDMADTNFMSSAGLIALHSIALLLQGATPPDPEAGWEAFHAMDRDREKGLQQFLKLLNPQPSIARSLKMTGFDQFIEVHQDRSTAIASFI